LDKLNINQNLVSAYYLVDGVKQSSRTRYFQVLPNVQFK